MADSRDCVIAVIREMALKPHRSGNHISGRRQEVCSEPSAVNVDVHHEITCVQIDDRCAEDQERPVEKICPPNGLTGSWKLSAASGCSRSKRTADGAPV
jgi:hypothetical protein